MTACGSDSAGQRLVTTTVEPGLPGGDNMEYPPPDPWVVIGPPVYSDYGGPDAGAASDGSGKDSAEDGSPDSDASDAPSGDADASTTDASESD
jgi:hypothetical protein